MLYICNVNKAQKKNKYYGIITTKNNSLQKIKKSNSKKGLPINERISYSNRFDTSYKKLTCNFIINMETPQQQKTRLKGMAINYE